MPEVSDEKLMQRYAKGDVTAFNELYQRHRGALYRYFFRQVSDPVVANDLYQGTWEKVIRSRNSFQNPAPFAAWLYRIAHNHLVDHFRKTRLSSTLESGELKDHRPDPSEAAIDDEQHRQLHEGILGLPEDQRSALLLKLESGLKVQEIAFATGVSHETVKSRLRYAVSKLKKSLVT
jgi:RNA polymerase sigma-70 factor (ECF subfamily)